MSDSKISDLSDAGALQAGDKFVVARSSSDLKKSLIGFSELVYRYTVAGSDKASIDTGADTADAGTNDWTNADLLEVFIAARTDEAAARSSVNITVNNDTGANYDQVFVAGINATASAANVLAQNNWAVTVHGSSGGASYAGAISLWLPDFSGTAFFKIATLLNATPDSTAANNEARTRALGWRSTAAITRLAIAAPGASKLKVGSQLLIYKRLAA